MTETWTIALTTSMTRNPPNQGRSSLCQFPLQKQEASRENAVWEPNQKGIPCMWIRTDADKQKIP